MTARQQTHTNPIIFSDAGPPRDRHGLPTLAIKDWRGMMDGCAPFLAQTAEDYGCDAPNIQAWLVELPNGIDAWFTSEVDAETFVPGFGALLRATAARPADHYYSREIVSPKTKREGLVNFVQMIINLIESGDNCEALLTAVDLRQDLMCNSNPYCQVIGD